MDIARLPVPVSPGRRYPQRVNRTLDQQQAPQSYDRSLPAQPPPVAGQAVQGELLLNQRFYGRHPGQFQSRTYNGGSSSEAKAGSGLQAQRAVGAYLDNARLGTAGAQAQGRSVDYFV
ncbi:MAG: hypothetical protein WCC36_12965 [Gammaproteobacteria bacterium]